MRTEITRSFWLEAAHQLPNVPPAHKCARLHGHSFHVTLVVGGDLDTTLGWIIDFADIDAAWKPIHEALDHRFLNDVPGLENPTSELLARWILGRVKLPGGFLVAVKVSETCTASCTVYADT